MAEHYFTNKPTVSSNELTFSFELKGNTLQFTSDSGVFSKKEVDFGSRLLIESFAAPSIDGDVLDVGCGYGPIGLALAKVESNRTFHLIDVNERAVELAKSNAKANGVENVDIRKSDLFENVQKNDFAAVVTNPPIRAGKKVVHTIFEKAYSHLQNGGELWVVIQKKQGAPSALEKMKEMFVDVEIVNKSKGYFIIRAKKV